MEDKEQMIKQILATVRADPSLWPKEYTKEEAENFLAIIEELVSPQLNSRGVPITESGYNSAKDWARRVMDIYIQKNPFQGAFVRPFAVNMFETLDKMWLKRSSQNKNGSWL